jgi:hypothetical protein
MTGIEWDSTPAPGSSPAAGTAANDFLAGLTEGPGSSAAADKRTNAGTTLKTVAQNGSFAVNEEGFNAYIKACDFFLAGYNRMQKDLILLTQEAEMGSSTYAKTVAKFNTTVAEGIPEASMLPNLEKMNDAVTTARQALEIARKNYRESDHANSVTFSQLAKNLDDK